MLIQLYSVKVIYFFRAGKAEKEGRWKMKNESVLNCEPTTRQLAFFYLFTYIVIFSYAHLQYLWAWNGNIWPGSSSNWKIYLRMRSNWHAIQSCSFFLLSVNVSACAWAMCIYQIYLRLWSRSSFTPDIF